MLNLTPLNLTSVLILKAPARTACTVRTVAKKLKRIYLLFFNSPSIPTVELTHASSSLGGIRWTSAGAIGILVCRFERSLPAGRMGDRRPRHIGWQDSLFAAYRLH